MAEDFGSLEDRTAALKHYLPQLQELGRKYPELQAMISFNWEKMNNASLTNIHEIGKAIFESDKVRFVMELNKDQTPFTIFVQ